VDNAAGLIAVERCEGKDMNQSDNIMRQIGEYTARHPDGDGQALRAAIEQALGSGEPVAYRYWDNEEGCWRYGEACCAEKDDELLYIAAPQPQRDDTALLRQALEALELALSSNGVLLLSDPPQDAWKFHGVDGKGREAIAALRERLK
jgi:hypothetical protein